MAERFTIDRWGARLNLEGEELTIEQAMLLSLGHLNARLEMAVTALQDMQMRLHRMELFVEETIPGYADHKARMEREEARRASQFALAGGQVNGAV